MRFCFFIFLIVFLLGCQKAVVDTTVGLDLESARKIAVESDCVKEGPLTEFYFYNENTKTWWFDLDVEKEGCAPACVVSEETLEAEINWRCTGLIT